MSIDFSKAPEGATHYLEVTGGVNWYMCADGSSSVWVDGKWVWSAANPNGGLLIPIPPLSTVEGAQPTGSAHDPVNSPSHYASGGVECIEAIKASMSHEAFMGYLKGNGMKYLWRYEKKYNQGEDLKKAQWYLARLTKEQEGE